MSHLISWLYLESVHGAGFYLNFYLCFTWQIYHLKDYIQTKVFAWLSNYIRFSYRSIHIMPSFNHPFSRLPLFLVCSFSSLVQTFMPKCSPSMLSNHLNGNMCSFKDPSASVSFSSCRSPSAAIFPTVITGGLLRTQMAWWSIAAAHYSLWIPSCCFF